MIKFSKNFFTLFINEPYHKFYQIAKWGGLNWYEEYNSSITFRVYNATSGTDYGVGFTTNMRIVRIGKHVTLTVGYDTRLFSIVIPVTGCMMRSSTTIPTQFLPSTGGYLYFAPAMYDITSLNGSLVGTIGGVIARCWIDSSYNSNYINITGTTPSTSNTNTSNFPWCNIYLYPFSITWCL